jgi:hypothetical protein
LKKEEDPYVRAQGVLKLLPHVGEYIQVGIVNNISLIMTSMFTDASLPHVEIKQHFAVLHWPVVEAVMVPR